MVKVRITGEKIKLVNPSIISIDAWDLRIRLDKRRRSDPAISWYDHCEAPSTLRLAAQMR